MRKHARFLYQPVHPLGKNRTFVTGSKAHLTIAADAATEGTVLLKNDGTLPLNDCTRLCLFGRGAGSGFLFGGGGSGRLHTAGRVDLAQGLALNGVEVFAPLVDFYSAYVDAETVQMEASPNPVYLHWLRGHDRPEPAVLDELYEQARKFSDIAVCCISRLSSEGSDYGDRYTGKGDFRLSDVEIALLEKLTRDFKKVIVILNVCGPVEMGYFKKNDSHYILFEEAMEGFRQTSRNRIKCKKNLLELTRQGLMNTNMVFEAGKVHMTDYVTPYGHFLLGIRTEKMELEEQEDCIRITAEYKIEIGEEPISTNKIHITICPRP